jgi:hypothetical protein
VSHCGKRTGAYRAEIKSLTDSATFLSEERYKNPNIYEGIYMCVCIYIYIFIYIYIYRERERERVRDYFGEYGFYSNLTLIL